MSQTEAAGARPAIPALDDPQPLKAALWMTGAIASFSSMAVAGRQVSLSMDTFELMTWRSVVGVLIVLTVALVRRRSGDIHVRRMGLHLIRNIAHFTGQNLWFLAITLIPLAQVFALEFTSPLWVALLAPLLLNERLTRTRALSAATGFLGILIVARPNPAHLDPGILAAATAAVCFALTAIFTKRLTRTEPVISILFWLTTMQAIFGVICALAKDGALALPDAGTGPWLVLIGCAGLLAHFCLTTALSLAPASIVIPFDFARLPVIAVVGMLLYHEPLDIFVFLGAALIFVANFVNIRAETRASVQR
ncbi:DMT family transporter [Acidimangrovimonas pyrenivorans]|uniref:DMT family transporter n=1 Tax=Acidimangrovimonas pyrenivorans TaxID=2030798 RepID=A0ABV7ADG5_9RHOB